VKKQVITLYLSDVKIGLKTSQSLSILQEKRMWVFQAIRRKIMI